MDHSSLVLALVVWKACLNVVCHPNFMSSAKFMVVESVLRLLTDLITDAFSREGKYGSNKESKVRIVYIPQ